MQYSIDNGTSWTSGFTAAEGTNSVQVRQIDVDSNVSPASDAFTFTLDTTAPAAPSIVGLTTDTGSSSSDKITSNPALTLTGVESDATVQYSFNGGFTWVPTRRPTGRSRSRSVSWTWPATRVRPRRHSTTRWTRPRRSSSAWFRTGR